MTSGSKFYDYIAGLRADKLISQLPMEKSN